MQGSKALLGGIRNKTCISLYPPWGREGQTDNIDVGFQLVKAYLYVDIVTKCERTRYRADYISLKLIGTHTLDTKKNNELISRWMSVKGLPSLQSS